LLVGVLAVVVLRVLEAVVARVVYYKRQVLLLLLALPLPLLLALVVLGQMMLAQMELIQALLVSQP
jgi:hypothetical protein